MIVSKNVFADRQTDRDKRIYVIDGDLDFRIDPYGHTYVYKFSQKLRWYEKNGSEATILRVSIKNTVVLS